MSKAIIKGNFTGQVGGNFPVDAETFQQLQDYVDAVAELASMYVGDDVEGAILSGCELESSGTRRGPGWLILGGKLVWYEGGLIADDISVVEEPISVKSNGVLYDAYVRRRAVAGNVAGKVGYYEWSALASKRTTLVDVPRIPIGSVMGWLRTDQPAPDGWLYCDGKQYRVSEYSSLYAVIGDKFTDDGMEGTSVFNVPTLYIGNANVGVGYYIIRAK